jgi:hypothetical protein
VTPLYILNINIFISKCKILKTNNHIKKTSAPTNRTKEPRKAQQEVVSQISYKKEYIYFCDCVFECYYYYFFLCFSISLFEFELNGFLFLQDE